MLGDMEIKYVPRIVYNLEEENGISERFKLTLMNAVREALKKFQLDYTYWTYTLADAVDKYNQLPQSALALCSS